jgi:hypothetical protein
MNKLFLFFLLVLFVQGCSSVDKDLWTFKEERPISKMNFAIKLRFNGYYQIGQEQFYKKGRCIHDSFILFDDGYFAAYNPTSLVNKSKSQIKEAKWMKWGRFILNRDSIVIQYFEDTGLGGTIDKHYTVQQLRGVVLNDTTIRIENHTFKNSTARCGYSSGIHNVNLDAPLMFYHKPFKELPSSENWLMEEFK